MKKLPCGAKSWEINFGFSGDCHRPTKRKELVEKHMHRGLGSVSTVFLRRKIEHYSLDCGAVKGGGSGKGARSCQVPDSSFTLSAET